MEIKLIRSGGMLPIIKEATLQIDWTAEECKNFLDKISSLKHHEKSSAARDGIDYTIEIDNTEMPINLDNVPSKYASVLNTLINNLKIVKQ